MRFCLGKMMAFVAAAAVAVLLAAPVAVASASVAPAPSPATQAPASLNAGMGAAPNSISAATAALCADDAFKAGFPYNRTVAGHPSIVVAVAIALAESSCNPSASATNGPTAGCPNGSTDRGLWQINDCYQWQVSNSCAYNAMCNAIGAYQISGKGANYAPWSTFNSGAYLNYISAAESAISGLTVTLFNRNTDRCLGADSTSTGNGSPVFQWACSSSNVYEQWHVLVVAGNLQVFKNVGR